MWRSVKIGLGIMMVAAVLAFPALAQTAAISVSATITNENCPAGFLLSQVIWLRGEQPIGLQILQVLIRQGQSYTVTQELSAMPTEGSDPGFQWWPTHRGTRDHGPEREVPVRHNLHKPRGPGTYP